MNNITILNIPVVGKIIMILVRFCQRLRQTLSTTFSQSPTDNMIMDGPRDSTLLIDASLSMFEKDWKPSRLEGAKESALNYIHCLRNNESDARVAVIAYGSDVQQLCPLTSVSMSQILFNSITNIECLGNTNITASLKRAQRLLRRARKTRQVILLTDGHHNTGPGPRKIAEQLKQTAIIETIGIGDRTDIDELLLKDIASTYPDGTKRYRWIGDKEQLVEHFHNLAGRISRA